VVYWCNYYTIFHCSLDIIEWFKYKLKKVFKLYLILIHPPLSINICYFPLKPLHQFYDSNARFHDRIETWLEESYSYNVRMNYPYDIFNIVDRVFQVLILPTFSLFLFQVVSLIFCHEHMFAGLGLQGWIHCHYEST
jgi:hypothetical protein